MKSIDPASFERTLHGARLFAGAVAGQVGDILSVLAGLPPNRAGVRIGRLDGLAPLLAIDGPIGSVAAGELGAASRPVRAILFDKTPETNWSLAWHQDRTICVERRVDADGFGPWTLKDGQHHVAPPFELLSRMVTLRVHLDPVSIDNAPLLIAPGSHRHGRVSVDAIDHVVRACGTHACLAEAGDIWLYATPILHASEAAGRPDRRRVLQVDYAAEDLPGELEWSGVGDRHDDRSTARRVSRTVDPAIRTAP